MKQETFWRAEDVAKFLKCSKGKAYAVMRIINAELKEQGKIVIKGRVPRLLVIRRTCGEELVA